MCLLDISILHRSEKECPDRYSSEVDIPKGALDKGKRKPNHCVTLPMGNSANDKTEVAWGWDWQGTPRAFGGDAVCDSGGLAERSRLSKVERWLWGGGWS